MLLFCVVHIVVKMCVCVLLKRDYGGLGLGMSQGMRRRE